MSRIRRAVLWIGSAITIGLTGYTLYDLKKNRTFSCEPQQAEKVESGRGRGKRKITGRGADGRELISDLYGRTQKYTEMENHTELHKSLLCGFVFKKIVCVNLCKKGGKIKWENQ